MRVEVISATEKPVSVISMAAGTCYNKGDTVTMKRVETCFNAGHLSVFEHANVSFRIEGISRACMAQLTRHRMASFCVCSQRYCRIDVNGNDWYVTPPSMTDKLGEPYDAFAEHMAASARRYMDALDAGIKPEDARYLLPEATKTNLVMTVNVRELFHILDMREASSAQWEIQSLAKAMREACEGINAEWRKLMGVRA